MSDEVRSDIRHFMKAASYREFAPWETGTFPQSKNSIDRLSLPEDWLNVIELCYFFYEREGIVRSIIDKQVEIAINGISIAASTKEEMDLYSYITPSLLTFLSEGATEYLLSGLVIPEIVWGTVAPEESGLDKPYIIPQDIWIRSPLQIDLKSTPLPNRIVPYWVVDSESIAFITNKGKYSDGTVDEETYKLLVENFPEFIKKVNEGVTKFALLDNFVIRRKPLLRTPYPIPYIMPALESLFHKRNLRKMDYALISRVINAILHVKVGNDTYPITEDDTDIITDLESQISRSGSANHKARIMELFTNHTVSLEWIVPNLDAVLDTGKYDEINQEILYSLGFPKFLVTGEKDKSNTGSSGSALLSPLNSMAALRKDFVEFFNYLFLQLAEKNGFSKKPRVSFAPLNLIELTDLLRVGELLEKEEIISRSSLAKLAGFDYETELHIRSKEEALITEIFGTPESPGDDTEENEEDNI